VTRENRLFTAVVAGAVGFYPLSAVAFEFGVNNGRTATTLLAVSFAFPALVGWLLYPSARTTVHSSQIDHERLAGGLYSIGGFCVFFGVGASAAYAVGRRLGLGGSLLTWTVACGVVSGVALAVLFWRN